MASLIAIYQLYCPPEAACPATQSRLTPASACVGWEQAEGPAVNRFRANGPCQDDREAWNAMKHILALSRARKSYGGKVVLDGVTLGLRPGAKVGVVGPNGTGKSTLLAMM